MFRFPVSLVTAIIFALPIYAFAEAPLPTTAPLAATSVSIDEKATLPATTGHRLKIGYVDVMKIAGESEAGKVAKSHFETKAEKYKTQIDTKQKLLEKQKATLEAKLPTYTPEQRAAKIKAYEKKVDELRKLLQKADQEMRPMQEELVKEVYAKVESAARRYGAANGFSAIIEKRELLYLGKEIDAEDVTAALIKELDKQ